MWADDVKEMCYFHAVPQREDRERESLDNPGRQDPISWGSGASYALRPRFIWRWSPEWSHLRGTKVSPPAQPRGEGVEGGGRWCRRGKERGRWWRDGAPERGQRKFRDEERELWGDGWFGEGVKGIQRVGGTGGGDSGWWRTEFRGAVDVKSGGRGGRSWRRSECGEAGFTDGRLTRDTHGCHCNRPPGLSPWLGVGDFSSAHWREKERERERERERKGGVGREGDKQREGEGERDREG